MVKATDTTARNSGVRGRPFKPGQSGNPNGRPPGSSHQDLRKALRDSVSVSDIEAIVTALANKAKEGDVAAAKELFDRLFGKSAMVVDADAAAGIVMNLIARSQN